MDFVAENVELILFRMCELYLFNREKKHCYVFILVGCTQISGYTSYSIQDDSLTF
jgi:hypothetical protein